MNLNLPLSDSDRGKLQVHIHFEHLAPDPLCANGEAGPIKRAGPQYNAEAHISESPPPLMTLKNFNSLNGMRPVHISVSQQNI